MLPVQARSHTRAWSHQCERRRLFCREVSDNLLAHSSVEQPVGGLAKRAAQQRAKPLGRGQLPPAVMNEEWHAAPALVRLGPGPAARPTRRGPDARCWQGNRCRPSCGRQPVAGPARRPSWVAPTTRPAPEGPRRWGRRTAARTALACPGHAHHRAELSPDRRRARRGAPVRVRGRARAPGGRGPGARSAGPCRCCSGSHRRHRAAPGRSGRACPPSRRADGLPTQLRRWWRRVRQGAQAIVHRAQERLVVKPSAIATND